MEPLDPLLLDQLRQMARRGQTPSGMLHHLLCRLVAVPDKITLVRYMREAFSLTLRQASSLFGWSPDQTGEIKDDQLDFLIHRAIQENRTRWDPAR